MREILSRAKRLDNGEWAYGNLVHSIDVDDEYGTIIIPMEESGMFVKGEDPEEHDLGFENWHLVDPNTICRNTGLTDKNGKKIFEGDIVSGVFDGGRIIGFIKYGSNAGYYIERSGLYGILLDNAQDWLEIVGNIFDNPELIGG